MGPRAGAGVVRGTFPQWLRRTLRWPPGLMRSSCTHWDAASVTIINGCVGCSAMAEGSVLNLKPPPAPNLLTGCSSPSPVSRRVWWAQAEPRTGAAVTRALMARAVTPVPCTLGKCSTPVLHLDLEAVVPRIDDEDEPGFGMQRDARRPPEESQRLRPPTLAQRALSQHATILFSTVLTSTRVMPSEQTDWRRYGRRKGRRLCAHEVVHARAKVVVGGATAVADPRPKEDTCVSLGPLLSTLKRSTCR